MGNDGKPRPGYDFWVAYDGHGSLYDPKLNENGKYVQHEGYVTDIMNTMAVDWISEQKAQAQMPTSPGRCGSRTRPCIRMLSRRPTVRSAWTVTVRPSATKISTRAACSEKPNMQKPTEFLKHKPVWAEAVELRKTEASKIMHDAIHSGKQEEIRLRAAMMAAVDEGVGMMFKTLEETGELDNTVILFLGDNGYFFGEHGLGPGAPFSLRRRHPRAADCALAETRSSPVRTVRELVILQDIAPTLLELAGGKPGKHIQGRSLLPLIRGKRAGWRKSFLVEYWAENAYPWLVGMSFKGDPYRPLQIHPLGQSRAQRRTR